MNLPVQYVGYMNSVILRTLLKTHLLGGIAQADKELLFLIAMYLGKDPEAKQLVDDHMRECGVLACTAWTQYFDSVQGMVSGQKSTVDVNQFLKGLDPGSKL